MAEKQKQPDPTSGLEAIIPELPTVTDGRGQKHTLRRLGLADVFRALRIISGISGEGQRRLIEAAKGQSLSLEAQVGMVLAYGLSSPETERGILEFLASLVGASYEEFANDPETWPLDVQLDIALKLVNEHPDITAFFTKVAAALKNPETSGRLSKLFGQREPGN